MFQRRKGDPTDIFLWLIIIFFLVISLVVAGFANSKVSEIISTTILNQSEAYESINSSFITINEYTVQRGFILFFGLLSIGILISSFLVRVHPVFMFLYIILLVVAIFVSVYLANAYAAVVANGQLAALADNYQTMTWVMQHIALILVGIGALSMVIIFGKIGGGTNTTDI